MRLFSIAIFSLLISLMISVKAQTGQSFWFVAPDILNTQDNPIVMVMSTYDNPALVTISIPANPAFTPLNYSIPANSTQIATLTTWKSLIETLDGDLIQDKGILVTSDQPITAYYEVQYVVNKEMFTLKGANALGYQFYVPFPMFGANGMGGSYSGFAIVAAEDSTVVTITPTNTVYFSSGVNWPANTTFSRTLNMGQTYAVRALGQTAGSQLAGSYVTSNKPIAITMKHDCMHSSTWGTCSELIGDQILPVEKSGHHYIIPIGLLNPSAGERAIVTAAYDSTRIYLDGSSTPYMTLNQGDYTTITLPVTPGALSSVVSAFLPITVLHISGNGCEFGSAMIPPVDGSYFVSSSVAFARSCPTNEIFSVMLITEAGNENSFAVNGNTGVISGSSFTAVPGSSGGWLEARINLSSVISTGQACRITNSTGNFHCGVLCGGTGSGCSYGYFTDFCNLITSAPENTVQPMVTIGPNPTDDLISVKLSYGSLENGIARVYDLLGSLVQEITLESSASATLNLGDLASGMYILVISDRNTVVCREKIMRK